MEERARAHDSLCVQTEALSDLLDGYVQGWNRQRPPTAATTQNRKFTSRGARSTLTAMESLTASSGLTRYQIDAIMRRRTSHTELRVADPLVAAIGIPEAFHDGRLPILQNPRASRATLASLTGSLGPELQTDR